MAAVAKTSGADLRAFHPPKTKMRPDGSRTADTPAAD